MKTIAVEHLTKKFHLTNPVPSGGKLSNWLSRAGWGRRAARDTILSLDDVSFAAEPGEAIGVIGQNGAGKSTLLKLLARTLRPTSGRIELQGRVGSLLEIGAGFHPELTGRENIFLNGSILGMGRREILRKLGEIVEFAEVGRQLDEPVKYYSSGMYMRLAFSIAAHIEPEILLLDEVMAVGDADFQKKCMSRIAKLGEDGITILFVSHNIPALLRLCGRALFLERGRLVDDGNARDLVARYLRMRRHTAECTYDDLKSAPGNGHVRLSGIRVRSRSGETVNKPDSASEIGLEMEFVVLTPGLTVFPVLIVNGEYGELFRSLDVSSSYHASPRAPGRYRSVAWVPANFLAPGILTVTALMYSDWPYREHFCQTDAVSFEVIENDGGSRGQFRGFYGGVVRPLLDWTVEFDPCIDDRQRSTFAAGRPAGF